MVAPGFLGCHGPGGSTSLALDRRALCEVVLRGTWTMWLRWSWRKFLKSFRSYHSPRIKKKPSGSRSPFPSPTTKGSVVWNLFWAWSLLHHGRSQGKFSNFLRVALLQHVFTELMPLPLGPLAEKAPLNLTAAWQDLMNLWDEMCMNWCTISVMNNKNNMVVSGAGNVSSFLCNFGPTKEDLKLGIFDFCVVDAWMARSGSRLGAQWIWQASSAVDAGRTTGIVTGAGDGWMRWSFGEGLWEFCFNFGW